ncbi:hypothetical protein C0995_016387, partial [Termitomyces sp. Mi166
MECQPTSSRVKVEDLVTGEEEQSAASALETTKSERSFWDQPVGPPDIQWAYDPWMPSEWNEAVASMMIKNWVASLQPTGEVYRQPTADEISEPSNIFVNGVLLKAKSVSWSTTSTVSQPPAWQQEFVDIVNGTKEELPPWREVNHEINLIDEGKQYKYHLPRCLRVLQEQLCEKTNRYLNAKWWEPQVATQAALLLCIPKKDGTLWTVLDARQRNDNTIKDVTPLPDQEVIHEDVVKARYRSKIDLTDAYKQ